MNDLELEERLRTDAERWNATRRTGRDLAQAMQRLTADAGLRPRSRYRPTLAVAAVVLVVSAVATAAALIGSGTTNTANTGALPTCGHAPTSFGRYASRVVATVSAPPSAASGSTIHPDLSIRALGDQPVRLDTGQPAPVYITQHGEVVGRYGGLVGGTGLGMTLTSKPTAIPVASLLLSGCSRGPIDFAHPDASRQPLPPGRYQIVATLAGGRHNHEWQIASTPSDITITNAPPTPDYACQRLSIDVVTGGGVTNPVAITGDVTQRVSSAAPARVTADIQPGCRAQAALLNDPVPPGVDVQTQVVDPVAPNEWLLDHEGQYRLTVSVGMCDLGPSVNPGCFGGLANLATVIITVTR